MRDYVRPSQEVPRSQGSQLGNRNLQLDSKRLQQTNFIGSVKVSVKLLSSSNIKFLCFRGQGEGLWYVVCRLLMYSQRLENACYLYIEC